MNKNRIAGLVAAWTLLLLLPGVLAAATVDYQYDTLNRLVRAAYSDGRSIVYTYDPAGNIKGTVVNGAPDPNATHRVTPSAGSHGSISPNTVQVVADQAAVAFTVTADAGYSANMGGTCGGSLSGTTYTTAPVTADCTVVASFSANDQSPLNDTGIATCSNATQNGLTCPVAGFPGQDADYGSNGFVLTKLDANGNTLPSNATNHACVRDDVTGLVWEVKTDDNGLRDKDATYTLSQAIELAGIVNTAGLCGFNDWRLPTLKELQGIVDYSRASPGPTIDTAYFPDASGYLYLSATLAPGSTSYVQSVIFQDGTTATTGVGVNIKVRLIRGEELVPSLADHGDGTVTDESSGLMWAKCAEGQSGADCATGSATAMTWGAALAAADRSTLAGYSDWRLPNIQELISLQALDRSTPSIDTNYFPNAPYRSFWSSSPYAGFQNYTWIAGFDSAGTGYHNRSDSLEVRARLVRDSNGVPGVADQDQDGVPDASDNCPNQPNPDQANHDTDANGDTCDADDDNDGIPDAQDAFPLDPSEQVDTDGDGTGDRADLDDDQDGVADTSDNCPLVSNPDQADDDGDDIGDACASSPFCWECLPNQSGWRSMILTP